MSDKKGSTDKSAKKDSKTDTKSKEDVAPSSPVSAPQSPTLSPEEQAKFDDRQELELELDRLKRQLQQVTDDKRRSEQLLSSLAAENWDFLKTRAKAVRSKFIEQMDALIADVVALTDQTRTQKQLSMLPSHTASEKNRRNISEKVFRWRESQLSVMLRQDDFRTVYHVFVAIFILFSIKVVLNEYLNESYVSFSLLTWNFGGFFEKVVPIWLAMFAMHFLIVPIMWLWRLGHWSTPVYAMQYASLQTAFICIFGYITSKLHLPIASGFVVLCEQTRMAMKMHAFWRETIRIKATAVANKPQPASGEDEDDHIAKTNKEFLPTFGAQLKQFWLFHFFPTLVYRNAYPRSRQIRWSFALLRFIEVTGCIFYTYVMFTAFCVPELQKTAKNPTDMAALVLSMFNLMLPSIVVYLLAFFGILHSWMNCWAELTRFADRQFYQDWWNSTSFLVYYRKWNMVVGDWLFNYVYSDIIGLGISKNSSMLLTFLISAVVHEYIISYALGFFFPVMFVLFAGAGVIFIYLTEFFKGHPFWNAFFWCMLIIGMGVLTVLYSREWYAKNGMILGNFDPNSWFPYSWQAFFVGSVAP